MGDEQRVPTDQLLRDARERFEEATDFTVAVEEEFALLDPVSLDLVNRFEDVQAAAAGTEAERLPRRRADRLRGRDQDRQGRHVRRRAADDRRAPRPARRARRAARPRARRHRLPSVGELEGPADHRHAALPAQRRAPPLRRLEEQHVRLPRPRRDQGRRPRAPGDDGAPQLAARAPGPVCELAVRRERQHGPPFGAHADLHALLPALWRPRRVPLLGRLRALRPVPLRHGLDHRAHAAVVERQAASRLPDGRDPHLRRPARPRRVAVARRALRRAHGAHRAGDRRGRDRSPTSRTG